MRRIAAVAGLLLGASTVRAGPPVPRVPALAVPATVTAPPRLLTVGIRAGAGAPRVLHIDDAGSHVDFSVRLLWIHRIDGRFGDVRGTVSGNGHGQARVDAWIDVGSAQMPSARDTRWLLSPDFFDVQRYPRIHFVSQPTALHVLRDGGSLRGDLTLRGVTRPVQFRMQPSRCLQPGVDHCSIRVRGRIDRVDFGMHRRRGLISDTVHLVVVIRLQHGP